MSSWIRLPKKDNIKNEAVLCAIALHEERYIDEWIQYHLKLGFYHIFIYDNSDNYSLRNKKSDRVSIIRYPGPTKQMEVYNLFIVNYRRKFKWGAFIDCDEFIVLKKHRTIMELLNDYQDCNALALHWRMFGTSHEIEYHDEPVTKRFHLCSQDANIHFKSICQLSHIDNYMNPHMPRLNAHKQIMDTNRTLVTGPQRENGPIDVACVHHYYTKSEQEFREKIERSRPDIAEKRSRSELDNIHNRYNEVENQDAWIFYQS